jgi:Flp pilus assembly protein TadG
MSRFQTHWLSLRSSEHGATAVEFALVIPLFVLLTVGTIGMCTMMYMTSALHFAVEDSARCASVKTATCSNQTTTSAYALTKYKGPTITGLTFTLTAAASGTCGNQVVGAGTYVLRTGLSSISVPVTATGCYPTGS